MGFYKNSLTELADFSPLPLPGFSQAATLF
jgi:hypothetical protein